MWPALAGNHRAVKCPRCGYAVVVGKHRADHGNPRDQQRQYGSAVCPNCGCGNLGLEWKLVQKPGAKRVDGLNLQASGRLERQCEQSSCARSPRAARWRWRRCTR